MSKRVSTNNHSAFYLNRWIQLAVFSLVLSTNSMLWLTFSPIAERVVVEYKLTLSQVNWLSLIFMVLYAVTIYPAFKVSERSTAKPIYICAVLQAIGALLRAGAITSDLSWLLFLGQVFPALSKPFILALPPKIAAQRFLPKQREAADALGVLASPLGVIAAFVITPLADLPTKAGFFKSSLFVHAVIAVVVAFIAVGIYRDPAYPPAQGEICLHDQTPRSSDPVDPTDPRLSNIDEPHSLETDGAETGGASNADAPDDKVEIQYRSSLTLTKKASEKASGRTPDKVQLSTWDGLKYVFRKKSIILVILTFGIAQGTMACLVTLIVALYPKYGEDDTSLFATLTVIGGLVGSAVMAPILGKTHAFKPIMATCYSAAVVLIIIIITTLSYDIMPAIATICFLIGFVVIPNIMVANELSVELTYLRTNEAMVAGLSAMTTQIIGIVQILTVGPLLDHGYLEIGWGIILGFFALAVAATLFIRVETNRLDAEKSLPKLKKRRSKTRKSIE